MDTLLPILAAVFAIGGIILSAYLTFHYRNQSKEKQNEIQDLTHKNLELSSNIDTVVSEIKTISTKINDLANNIDANTAENVELSKKINELSNINNKISNKLLYPIPNTFFAEIGISFKFQKEINTTQAVSSLNKGNNMILFGSMGGDEIKKLENEFLSRIKSIGVSISSLEENTQIGFSLTNQKLIPVRPTINDQGNLGWYGYNIEKDYFFLIAGRFELSHFKYVETNSLLDYDGRKFRVDFSVSNIHILNNSETSIFLFSDNTVIAKIGDFKKKEGALIGTFRFITE